MTAQREGDKECGVRFSHIPPGSQKMTYPLFLFWLFFMYFGKHFSRSSRIFNNFLHLACCRFNPSAQFMSTSRLPLPGSVGHSHQTHKYLLTQWLPLVFSFRTLQCIHRQMGVLCSRSNGSLLLPRASSQGREAFYGLNIVNIEQFFL